MGGGECNSLCSHIIVEFVIGASNRRGYERGEFVKEQERWAQIRGGGVGLKKQTVYDKNMLYKIGNTRFYLPKLQYSTVRMILYLCQTPGSNPWHFQYYFQYYLNLFSYCEANISRCLPMCAGHVSAVGSIVPEMNPIHQCRLNSLVVNRLAWCYQEIWD